MATQVSVITASTGVTTFYSTYAAAWSAASSGDLIQIWADLSDEQILLKDGVDMWIAPGRILSMSNELPVITDNNGTYTVPVTCSITGNGVIRNDNNADGCIRIINGASNISIQCDSLEGIGWPADPYKGATVVITNITDAQKFSLKCKKITSQYNAAIAFDAVTSGTNINSININVNRIETGIADDDSTVPAVVLKGTGFVEIEEITCHNSCTCLLVEAGNITANILKMTTKNINHFSAPYSPAVEVSGGDGTQKLELYFDEIQGLSGGDAVKISNGTATLIGRRIYSEAGLSLNLIEDIVRANVQCVDIISGGRCININNSDDQILIDANYIEGNTGPNDGVVYSNNGGNFFLRNAKIKNLRTSGTSPFSLAIYLGNTGTIDMMIENLICVTSDSDQEDARTILSATSRNVKNLGLFVNRPVSGITLKIGDASNNKFIIDPLVS